MSWKGYVSYYEYWLDHSQANSIILKIFMGQLYDFYRYFIFLAGQGKRLDLDSSHKKAHSEDLQEARNGLDGLEHNSQKLTLT